MHQRWQNDQTAEPGVIKGGEVERGRATLDPPGALAKDIDIKRQRARRCWPRRVLTGSTGPEAGRLSLSKAVLAVVLLLTLVGTSITWAGIRAALKEETLDSAAADAIKLNGTRETDQVGEKGLPGSLKEEEGGVGPPSETEGRFVHNMTAQHDSEGKIARAGAGVAAEAASTEETVDSAAAATDVKKLNGTRETDQVGEKRISPEASASRKSKQAKEVRGSRSPAKPLLVADFKWTEGVNAQLVTLGTFLAVANATGRELLLVPFRSAHYVNHTTGRRADHYIRMEDYFDNSPGAWPGWRTADPHDGSAPDIVRSLLQWRGDRPTINQTVEEAEGSKGCVHSRVIASLHPWKVNMTPFEDVVKAIAAVPGGEVACIVGRVGQAKGSPGADFFELNTLARKLSQRGLAAIRAGAALAPDAKLSAVHLRRGDRCRGRGDLVAGEKVRCGPVAGLPFMNLCAELREKGGGLYVATEEEDRSFLEALRDGGCFVREDMGIDFVAEAEAANDEREAGGWRSVHPQALEFAMEMNILRHAEEFYTLDQISSIDKWNVRSYRARHGLSKPRVFGDETTMAAATSGSAHLTKDNGPVARRGDRGKNHTELVVQQKNSSRKIHFQTTHKMGTLALSSFIRKYFSDIQDLITFGRRVQPYAEEPTVVVVRDMFGATVSGYLYHKTGRECLLDHRGTPNPIPRKAKTNDWLRRFNWTKIVLKVPVPENIRSLDLCQALNSTDETIGIGIYLEFAREQFYRSVAELKSRTKDPTLFVCYDDILSDGGRVQTERRIRSFIGHQSLNASATSGDKLRRRLNLAGHSTDPDPELRARLRDIARNIDCTYFGCETTAWNDALEECSDETTMAAVSAPSSSRQVKAGRLVAITNEEGITAQKVTLESFMRLAYETRRNLLLIPFQSAHYKDPIGHRVFVRLEDYIDNATESLDWHTLDPYERVDESLLEMISDPVNNCIRGNYVQNGFATISMNSTTDNPDYYKAQYPKSTGQSRPEPTPSLRSIAEEIDLKRNDSDACVAGRIWTIEPQFRKTFPLNPSSPVIDLAERGIRNLLSKPNDSGNLTSIVTLHLRRGDKCFKDPLSVACAFVDKLPFLELCESMWKDGIGMYVSTNENSPSVLQKLRDRKCLLAEDLKMNFVEEAKRLNSRSPDAWNSYHPDALQFSTEAYLLMNANETYSMGCSSLLSEMMRYRSGAHLSPAKIYSAVHGEFDHLKNWGEQHCPQQQ